MAPELAADVAWLNAFDAAAAGTNTPTVSTDTDAEEEK